MHSLSLHLLTLGMARLLFTLLLILGTAEAQSILSPSVTMPGKRLLCNPAQYLVAKQLTLRQRSCWYSSELVSPWAAMRAGISSGMGQWKNEPYSRGQDGDEYAERFANYYVKRTAKETGELMAGYFNHEDPRLHASGEMLLRRRIRSALLSVLVNTTEGSNRPALAPIAGSIGSSFAGAILYREHYGAGYLLRGASATYSGYFGRALYQEFRPDTSFLINRITHIKRD